MKGDTAGLYDEDGIDGPFERAMKKGAGSRKRPKVATDPREMTDVEILGGRSLVLEEIEVSVIRHGVTVAQVAGVEIEARLAGPGSKATRAARARAELRRRVERNAFLERVESVLAALTTGTPSHLDWQLANHLLRDVRAERLKNGATS
jgi:hypothetical protein